MKRLILATVSSAILMVAMAGAAVAGPSAVGACNMLRDATMGTIPMAHDAQGNAGMFHAVYVSGNVSGTCP
jgi:hypothetical protein